MIISLAKTSSFLTSARVRGGCPPKNIDQAGPAHFARNDFHRKSEIAQQRGKLARCLWMHALFLRDIALYGHETGFVSGYVGTMGHGTSCIR
jgi:hypothetical protein